MREIRKSGISMAEADHGGVFYASGIKSGKRGGLYPLKQHRNLGGSKMAPHDAVEFHRGYVSGLSGRLAELSVSTVGMGLSRTPEHILDEDIGIVGLNAGLQRQAPLIPDTEARSKQNTAGAHYLDGYRIGWVMAMVKKYGKDTIPSGAAIPTTSDLFKLYKMAEQGDFSAINYREEREDSQTREAKRIERRNLSPEEISLLATKELEEETVRAVLAFAIDRWLNAKGITVIRSDVILHLDPWVRRGFASVVNCEANAKKNGQSEKFEKGVIFARKILEIERNLVKEKE